MQNNLTIEVVYARSAKFSEQTLLNFQVLAGTTIEWAILNSGILQIYPEIDLNINKVGIFGKIRKLTDLVKDQDRVEIYRKLPSSPNTLRKFRASQKVF